MTQVKSLWQIAREWRTRCGPPKPTLSLDTDGVYVENAYIAGHRSRDAELAQLRAEAAGLRAALKFYGNQEHFGNLEDWETCSGEPTNWLFPPDDREEMIEDGGVARKALATDAGREAVAEMQAMREALTAIDDLDNEPQNHHRDASKCAICIGRGVSDRKREILAANTGKAGDV